MLVIKSGQYGILEKLGVASNFITALKSANVKIGVGAKDISFYHGSDLLSAVSFPKLLTDIVNGKYPQWSAQNTSAIEGAITEAVTKKGVTGLKFSKAAKAAQIEAMDQALLETQQKEITSNITLKPGPMPSAHSDAGKDLPMAILKDASALYQRVRGTSDDSVYVVVAMGSGIKVAARYHHQNRVSLRVEGNLTAPIRAAFLNHNFALGKSGEYMSMHAICENVPADRVVGAVLAGVGLEFDTPIPNLFKVRALSK